MGGLPFRDKYHSVQDRGLPSLSWSSQMDFALKTENEAFGQAGDF